MPTTKRKKNFDFFAELGVRVIFTKIMGFKSIEATAPVVKDSVYRLADVAASTDSNRNSSTPNSNLAKISNFLSGAPNTKYQRYRLPRGSFGPRNFYKKKGKLHHSEGSPSDMENFTG